VILDGNGIVKSVHLGFDAEATRPLDKILAEEIDEILEGKSVAIPRVKADEGSRRKTSLRIDCVESRSGWLPVVLRAVSIDYPSAKRLAPITASLRLTRCRER
jgi:hypothetical protein